MFWRQRKDDKRYQNDAKDVEDKSVDITARHPTLSLPKGKIEKGFGPSCPS